MTEELIHEAIRKGTLSLELTPVFMGSAYKNKGVQPLLDAVDALPAEPARRRERRRRPRRTTRRAVALASDPNKPLVALAFKLEDGRYGQLTYVRIYQGTLAARASTIVNSRTAATHKVGRLVRMHADEMEDIDERRARATSSRCSASTAPPATPSPTESIRVAMTSMHVPAPVISLAIKPKDNKAQDNMAQGAQPLRAARTRPSASHVDPESSETIISGMGELHLDVYVERMKREYGCEVETGAPQVAYRETISQRAEFNYTHKKQTGGSGQYGRVAGYIEPHPEGGRTSSS